MSQLTPRTDDALPGLPGVTRDESMDDVHYELFISCMLSMFRTEEQRSIISHYIWGSEERLKMFISHLRLFDLLRRAHSVVNENNPTDEEMLCILRHITLKHRTQSALKYYVEHGVFPNTRCPDPNLLDENYMIAFRSANRRNQRSYSR